MSIRSQGVGLDDFMLRWGNRLIGRRKKIAAWPARSAPARGPTRS